MSSTPVDLAKVDWGTHVPATDGTIDGADLHNLHDIASGALKDKPEIQKKCWKFATVQESGAKTYGAGKILTDCKFEAKEVTMKFEDGDFRVDLYKLSALKKDYPDFKTSDLAKLSRSEFDAMIHFLYERTDMEKNVDGLDAFKKMGINDLAIKVEFSDWVPSDEDLVKCPIDKLPKLLEAIIKKYPNFDSDSKKTVSARDAIRSISAQVHHFDPTKREHIKVAAELYKVVNNDKEILKYVVIGNDNAVKDNIKHKLNVSLSTSEKPNLIKSFIQSLASFFSDSLASWFDVDREFILNVLKGVPNLELAFSSEIPKSMIDELRDMDNLKKISIPVNSSQEFKNNILSLRKEIEMKYQYRT